MTHTIKNVWFVRDRLRIVYQTTNLAKLTETYQSGKLEKSYHTHYIIYLKDLPW